MCPVENHAYLENAPQITRPPNIDFDSAAVDAPHLIATPERRLVHIRDRLPANHPATRLLNIALLPNGYKALIRQHRRERINVLQERIVGPQAQAAYMQKTGVRAFPPFGYAAGKQTSQVINTLVAPYRNRAKRAVKRFVYYGQAWFIATRMKRSAPDLCVCWNGVRGHRRLFMDVAKARNAIHLYMEESPIPGRITCDFGGVNFGNSLPRRMDFYRIWQAKSGLHPHAWRGQRNALVARVTDTPHTAQEKRDLTGEGNYIFCPLQVPSDSQVLSYGGRFKSMQSYVAELCEAANTLPKGWHLRIKEHPSARTTFRALIDPHLGPKLKLDNNTDTFVQVQNAQAVLTLNSSVGIQAFYFDKPVMTLGQSFWDFGRLAEHLPTQGALRNALADPAGSRFCSDDRNAFMNYLTFAYYFAESDIAAGRVGINDVVQRDMQRDDLLRPLLKNL